MTTPRLSTLAVGICAVAGLAGLTACGSGTDSASAADDGIATLERDGTAAGDDASDDAGDVPADEAALQFSQCLRDEGLDVADIGVDADGNIDLRSAMDSVDPGNEDFRAAMEACGSILGDVAFGGGRGGGDFDDTALQDAFLEFSECIRDQGFEDVPDLSFRAPGGGGPGADGGGPPADGSLPPRGEGARPGDFGDRSSIFAEGLSLDPEDPDVIAAIDACSPIIDDAAGSIGPGAATQDGEG